MYNRGKVFTVDAKDTTVDYTAKFTIDTNPMKCTGGVYHKFKLVIGDDQGNTTNVDSFIVANCEGSYSWADETRNNGGKAKLRFPIGGNPGLVKLFTVIQNAVKVEIQRVGSQIGVTEFNNYILEGGSKEVNGQTIQLSECMITQVKLNRDSTGCVTQLLYGTDVIFSNDTFEEGEEVSTIRAYVKESGYDKGFVTFLERVYGKGINVVKSPSNEQVVKITLKPKDMLTKRMLIKPNEFSSTMRNYFCNHAYFRIKTCYVRTSDPKLYCSLVVSRCNSDDRIDRAQEEEDEWNASLKLVSKKKTEMSMDEVELDADGLE